MRQKKKSFLLPGEMVQVRSWEDIRATLDENGELESMPFMPEMTRFCGQRFIVSKRIERTCEEIRKDMRRIRNTVYLADLRCDGSEHGGCPKGYFLFWKEAWLQRGVPVQPTDPGGIYNPGKHVTG